MSRRPDTPFNFLNSLRGRLIAASLLTLPLFTGASGLLLERAFKDSLIAGELEQLQSQFYVLLGAAELQDGELYMPAQLPDPRYSGINSGLYGQIAVAGSGEPPWQVQWQSESARLLGHPLPVSKAPYRLNYKRLSSDKQLFRFTRDLQWLNANDQPISLRVEIFHSRDSYKQQLKTYRQQLWYGLAMLSMGLLLIQLAILAWGLRPLRRLTRQIRRLPGTPRQRLSGRYPDEIRPLTDSLNDLLSSEQQQRERYKNTLGDLAHSLKTPLAILQGEVQQEQQNLPLMREQLERMGAIIRHQLQRAVLQTDQKRHSDLDIAPVAERLCAAMSKVYRDKNIHFDIDILADTRYPIESQDLFEMLGNLIENACKYGRDQVTIRAATLAESLLITVADNGPGVASEQRHTILQRGARADTAQPGQGIGLAVATDIISAYRGSLDITRSKSLGGAEFQVRLPITS